MKRSVKGLAWRKRHQFINADGDEGDDGGGVDKEKLVCTETN